MTLKKRKVLNTYLIVILGKGDFFLMIKYFVEMAAGSLTKAHFGVILLTYVTKDGPV